MSYFAIHEGIPVITNIPQPGGIEVTPEQKAEILGVINAGGELAIADGSYSIVKAERDPLPTPVPPQITFSQLLIGLVAEQWITEAEGEAWLSGTVPAAATTLINSLPAAQQFAARARVLRPSVVLRSDPLVAALAAAENKDSDDLDAFFTTYAAV